MQLLLLKLAHGYIKSYLFNSQLLNLLKLALQSRSWLLISHECPQALMKHATDAMKESRVHDLLSSLSVLQYGRMDFEEFCAATINIYQLEALDRCEQYARCAYELFENDGNRAIMIEELASPNSIILAISPTNQGITTTNAIKLANTVDPSGERTFGILTKLDLMDKGTTALDVLEGRAYRPQDPSQARCEPLQKEVAAALFEIDYSLKSRWLPVAALIHCPKVQQDEYDQDINYQEWNGNKVELTKVLKSQKTAETASKILKHRLFFWPV
ncbi:phosphorylase kinase, gamma catalytic subunit, EF-hand domain pair [Artemisia annua]|uniref:Phosphorylase kinase, gamma catalytic subunit, EF-hand domain pair n=1 Tax=Artemisia annua TaxID=35608 RepID=A0A2U1PFT3_ARTAN|nr:phosphorylase kinase, gamma catalytic subunit, EF-hand domain pair [Artemisia annua]